MASGDFVEQVYIEAGKNIRYYRKLRHMTQKELAEKLFKSMACISKYESGLQPIDLHTIYKIAEILSVSPAMLLPNRAVADASISSQLIELPSFFQKAPLFLYDVRSGKNEVIACAIDIQPDSQQVVIYFDIKDPVNFKNCEYIMFGTIAVCEANIRIYCSNPLLKGDFILICVRMADLVSNTPFAFMTTLSTSYKFRSSKCLISKSPIPNPQSLSEKLSLSRADINNIRRQNHFSF